MTAPDHRSAAARWLYATKPASWPKLLVPALLGQSLGVAAAGAFDWRGLLVGFSFTVLGLLFIVLLNDWGDREVDAIKRRMFPDGCSPKTIPDGILSARQLLWAGLLTGALAAAAAWLGGKWLAIEWLGWMGLADMTLFVAYTLPPARLNYRGGGELLEMLGVGVALPWFNAYAQGGVLIHGALWILPGFAVLSLASAVASGLSDEESDRQGGKTTVVTRHGNALARRLVEACVVSGVVAWGLGMLLWIGAPPLWSLLPVLLLVLWNYRRLRLASPGAVTSAFGALADYKRHLHRGIWQGATLLAILVLLNRVVS